MAILWRQIKSATMRTRAFKRPSALQALFAVLALIMLGSPAAAADAPNASDAPILLDARRQLFLDDYLVASMTRVRRTVEQAQKFAGNPVLWPSESWEPL